MPYHVRISTSSKRNEDEVKLDLSRAEVEGKFLLPYRAGQPILIGGRFIAPRDISRMRINYTEEDAAELARRVATEREANAREGIFMLTNTEWEIASRGTDVSDELLASAMPTAAESKREETPPLDPRMVFVVHGRNLAARDAMFSFLRTLDLKPIEWAEARAATGRPTPYVGDILSKAFEMAAAIVVLMTPDDLAHLKPEFHSHGEPPHETEPTGQARPNVLFEAGMAMGRDENRTVIVELGSLRPFSDIGGRHALRLDNTTERRQELAQRLISAGAAASTQGVDWHTTGDFAAALDSEVRVSENEAQEPLQALDLPTRK